MMAYISEAARQNIDWLKRQALHDQYAQQNVPPSPFYAAMANSVVRDRVDLIHRMMQPDIDNPPLMGTRTPYESMHPRIGKVRKPKRVPEGTFFDPTPNQHLIMRAVALYGIASLTVYAMAAYGFGIGVTLGIGSIAVAAVLDACYQHAVDCRREANAEQPDTTDDDLLKYHYQELADFDAKLRAETENKPESK